MAYEDENQGLAATESISGWLDLFIGRKRVIYVREEVVIVAILVCMWVWFCSRTFVIELYGPIIIYPSVRDIIMGISLLRTFDFRIEGEVIYLRKAKSVYEDFIETCKVLYLGSSEIHLNNNAGVRYPIDFFVKHFYDRYYVNECNTVFSKYKRVNPTLDLKLAHLDEFGEPNPFDATSEEVLASVNSIWKDFKNHGGYLEMLIQLKTTVEGRDFYNLNVDKSSAAGYPYEQGVKRKDVFYEAANVSKDMMDDAYVLDEFLYKHVWYTTGRVRMREVDQEDKGRLIMYSGFSPMLIGMLYCQPIAEFMNKHIDWCAVGMSWMHGGAQKFAEHFQAVGGRAPKGYRYVSVDIKNWDTKLHPKILKALGQVYERIFEDAGLSRQDIHTFRQILDDMINAKVLLPLGKLFQVFQGMKSGWCNTANDNTLMHKIIFNVVQNRLGLNILHELYGDDNFMLVPDFVSDDDLIRGYAALGCVVGRIHSSIEMCEVDFLAKYVHFKNGSYYIFRPAIETHARLLMPEESNPGRRDRPDAEIAAERFLGHLYDNPFCESVQVVCLDMLKRLKDMYMIDTVLVTEKMRNQYPWRGMPDLPSRLPCVPDIRAIEELYEVSMVKLSERWPDFPKLYKYDVNCMKSNSLRFDTAYDYSVTVSKKFSLVGKKNRKKVVSMTSPYVVPKGIYGTHAARAEFAVRWFALPTDRILDFGSHPGACAASFLKRCNDVTCVSLKPDCDANQPFCPYVFRDKNVKFVQCMAEKFEPDGHYSFIHDDVDFLGPRSRLIDVKLAEAALGRAFHFSDCTNAYILTIREFNPKVFEDLYCVYKRYGHFDIIKPYYSHPWRCEFMICFKKTKRPPVRKVNFFQSIYYFLDQHVSEFLNWNECLSGVLSDKISGKECVICPWQLDGIRISNLEKDFCF